MRDRTHAVQAREVLEVRALVVDSRSACVAVGSPPPGARACARARLREARIFPFASGRPFSSRRRGGRSSDSPTRALATIGPPCGRVRVSRRLFAHTTAIFFTVAPRHPSLGAKTPPARLTPRRARREPLRRFARSAASSPRAQDARFESRVEAGRDGEHHARDAGAAQGRQGGPRVQGLLRAPPHPAQRVQEGQLLPPVAVRARPPRVREVPVQRVGRARARRRRSTRQSPPLRPPRPRRKSPAQIDRSSIAPPCPLDDASVGAERKPPSGASDPAPSPPPARAGT